MNPTAFCQGYDAHDGGMGYNGNPYDEESEAVNYNAWMVGWSAWELIITHAA